MARKASTSKPWRPGKEWWARFDPAKRTDHLFRHAIHLERLVNATDADLQRWPHAFLFAASADYGDTKRAPDEWDRLERQAEMFFKCSAPQTECIRRIKGIREGLRWVLKGLVALEGDGRRRVPPDQFTAWAHAACRYVIAVSENLGWGTDRPPRSRNSRSWRGITEGGTPGNPESGRPVERAGRKLAFREPHSLPRFCSCRRAVHTHHKGKPCDRFFHARRETATLCPACRE